LFFEDRVELRSYAVYCRQLTGLYLKTKEGLKEYYAEVHDYACFERLKFSFNSSFPVPRPSGVIPISPNFHVWSRNN